MTALQVVSVLMEKEEMTDVKLLVEHIREASCAAVVALIWPTGPITVQK